MTAPKLSGIACFSSLLTAVSKKQKTSSRNFGGGKPSAVGGAREDYHEKAVHIDSVRKLAGAQYAGVRQ
jgi:hypothetical protein